jgi:hypothetical protein
MSIATPASDPTHIGTRTAPARRALYLMVTRRMLVRTGAESLGVFEGRICRGRYPLSRVSRILATRQIDWRGDALAACLARGIGIVFVDAHGNWYGSCAPALTRVSPLSELLDELVEDARWPQSFDNFMRHLRSRILLDWLTAHATSPPDTVEVVNWRRCYVYQGQVPHALGFDYRGLLRSLVEARLHKHLIRVRYRHGDGNSEELDLADHLCGLVYGQILMHAGAFQFRVRDNASAIRFFEAAADDYLHTVDDALASLQRLLLDRSHKWQ